MKVKTPETGGIVQSLQGRDVGCYYVICEVQGDNLLLVNGVARTLQNPKKKNVKHVRLLPLTVAQAGITYPWDKAFDNRVAHYLKEVKERTENS